MTDDEKAIRAIITRWMEATAAGDLDAILALMHEDVVFLTPGSVPMCGRRAFAEAFTAMPEGMKFFGTSDVQEIDVSGQFAFCWTELKVELRKLDGLVVMTRHGNTLSFFKKNDAGSWQLYRDANLLGPPE